MLEKLNSYYNAETEYRILIIDNAYNTDCIEVGGDFETCIYKFPKIEFIGTFNEFRKDIYFRSQRWNRNKEQLLEWYIENKRKHKIKNNKLRELFCTIKKINFRNFLTEFVTFNKWKKFPEILNFDIINARYVGNDDGNSQSIVAEDDKNFYYVDACSS